MAGDLLTRDLIHYDPLTDTTRKERRALLGLSLLGVALVKVPLVPEKFAMLGIEFAKVNQGTFVSLYALVILYFLVAFILYAFTDYVAWRRMEVITISEYEHQRKERQGSRVNMDELLDDQNKKSARHAAGKGNPVFHGFASYWLAHGAAQVRAFFEFIVPVCFAGYSLGVLLAYSPAAKP